MTNTFNLQQIFPTLEPALIAEMSQTGEIREFKEGETIMRTGQNIRSTMLVLEGRIKIYREDDEGNEFFMYYLFPGKACALSLICAIRQETSEIMAKADTDATVIAIPFAQMDQWMMQYKSWYQFALGTYRERFEDLLQVIDHVAFRNMDERLVFYLKRHQEQLKTNVLPLTHNEIAQELNSSREVISRLLKKLAEKGMVKVHRQAIEIINLGLG
jgi:CRP/FNR family transcriptional regulator, anaerobic regulatory protein